MNNSTHPLANVRTLTRNRVHNEHRDVCIRTDWIGRPVAATAGRARMRSPPVGDHVASAA
jgi:hypothetical protein